MTQKVDKEKLWKLLFDVKEMLDELGIPFFLSVGTCLWLVRDGDILDDDDVDLGIMEEYEHRFKDIISAARRKGWTVGTFYDVITGKGRMISIFPYEGRDEGYVDIAFHYRFRGIVWKSLNNDYCIPEVFNANLFCVFKRIIVRDTEFLVPNPPEEYLKAIYGNWQVKNGGIVEYKKYWYIQGQHYRRCMIYQKEKAKKFLERIRNS